MSGELGLEDQAREFATRLSDLVSEFLDARFPFQALQVGSGFVVEPVEDLVLRVGPRRLLSVSARYQCVVDHANHYLVVEESSVKVFAGTAAKGDPLFRYEYVHDQVEDLPCAHLHLHAHRDQLATAMALAGSEGAKRRYADTGENWMKAGKVSALHFPLGGHRFRPGLEDVLQMLVLEFGVVPGVGWPAALASAREAYRRGQTGSVVRDCPSEAVRVLEEMGYRVAAPAAGPRPDRAGRLRAF